MQTYNNWEISLSFLSQEFEELALRIYDKDNVKFILDPCPKYEREVEDMYGNGYLMLLKVMYVNMMLFMGTVKRKMNCK